MKKTFAVLFLLVAFVFAFSVTTYAQGDVQVGVGYQFRRPDVDENKAFKFDSTHDSHGAFANVTGYVSKHVGITGDAAFNFGTDSRFDNSLVTVMGGLTVKARQNKQFQPFATGLVGVARERATVNQFSLDLRDVGLAFAAGGGLDIKVDDNLAIRVFEGRYLQSRTNGLSHNFEARVGLVF